MRRLLLCLLTLLAGAPAQRADAQAKNVLFLLSDQHRGDARSSEGHPLVKTPRLDRLADEGVSFARAYVHTPLCVPQRASLLTGRYPELHRCTNNVCRLPEEELTWGELLSARGFRTVAVGKTHGVDDGFVKIGVPYEDSLPKVGYEYSPLGEPGYGTSPDSAAEFLDARIADAALAQLAELAQGEAPFALFVGLHAPHPPFYPPRPYDTLYDPKDVALPEFDPRALLLRPSFQRAVSRASFQVHSERVRREYIAHYLGLVTFMDLQVGRILDGLEALGLLDDTLVVYTSDHGDNMAEHGLFGKSVSFYEGEARVPALLRLPGHLPAGKRVAAPIESVDLVRTLLDLLGVEAPAAMTSQSLLPLIAGGAPPRAYAYATIEYPREGARGMMICTATHKLAFYTGEPGELYDLERDPRERENLYADPAQRELRARLKHVLAEHQLGLWRAAGALGEPQAAPLWLSAGGEQPDARFRHGELELHLWRGRPAAVFAPERDPERAHDLAAEAGRGAECEALLDRFLEHLALARHAPAWRSEASRERATRARGR